jgi:hypothetical protein
MGWFRSNRCRVAWLAVFALACQLVLAFGHVHLGKPGAALDGFALAADIGNVSADNSSPAPHKKPSGLGDALCAICASIHLANTLITAVAPAVALPVLAVRHLRWSPAIDPAWFDRTAFDARGPPLA